MFYYSHSISQIYSNIHTATNVSTAQCCLQAVQHAHYKLSKNEKYGKRKITYNQNYISTPDHVRN